MDITSIMKPGFTIKSGFIGTVFVQGNFMRSATYQLMEGYGFTKAANIENADCVVWTGGEDIEPIIYGEHNVASGFNRARDRQDLAALKLTRHDAFKVGICRGAQLLNCEPNKGRLWQDIDGHEGTHHEILDTKTKKKHNVNSLHHQGMRINEIEGGELIAYCEVSREKVAEKDQWHSQSVTAAKTYEDLDAEVVWYPNSKSLCVQSHPEFFDKPTTNYFYELLDRFYHGKAA